MSFLLPSSWWGGGSSEDSLLTDQEKKEEGEGADHVQDAPDPQPTSTPDGGAPDDASFAERNRVAYEVVTNEMSDSEFKSLPQMPFQFNPTGCGLLVSRHRDFPYAAVVPHLDYMLLQHFAALSTRKVLTVADNVPVHEVVQNMDYLDDAFTIDAFRDMANPYEQLYTGVAGHLGVMDLLETMRLGTYDAKIFWDITEVLDNARALFEALYATDDGMIYYQ